MKEFKRFAGLLLIIAVIFLSDSCSTGGASKKDDNQTAGNTKYNVTFIELGSVRCIPCQKMQPVMKSVEMKYGDKVKVVFHDVWTEAGAPFAEQYGIEAIPTQVFLDETGKEYYRHVGFFPEEDLVKILQMKGIKIN